MTDLKKIAETIIASGPHKYEDSPRRIRVLLGGAYIFDTTSAKLVWEHPYYPQYYLPHTKFQNAELKEPETGSGFTIYSVVKTDPITGQVVKPGAVLFEKGPLAGYMRLDFKGFEWFEEDDPIYGHPADIYKRIDIRRSSRPIKVEVDGVAVAEAGFAMHLYETSLPVRYYLPRTSVRWDLLKPSDTTSFCPYKGSAQYFDIVINGKTHKDLVWWYQTSPLEALAVQNMVRTLSFLGRIVSSLVAAMLL